MSDTEKATLLVVQYCTRCFQATGQNSTATLFQGNKNELQVGYFIVIWRNYQQLNMQISATSKSLLALIEAVSRCVLLSGCVLSPSIILSHNVSCITDFSPICRQCINRSCVCTQCSFHSRLP